MNLKWLDRAIEFLLGALLVVLVVIGGLQIVWRYVFNSPLAWVGEVSVILMIWATMLAGYTGVRRNVHLSADFAGMSFSPAWRWRLEFAGLALCLLFVAVYGVASLKVVDAMDGIPFTTIPLNQPWQYVSLPVGAVLMALALLARLRAHWATRDAAGGA